MQVVYVLVGVPGVGKSWVAEQLKDRFAYISHDEYIGGDYLKAITHAARTASHPVLCETPFSLSLIAVCLSDLGLTMVPVYIVGEESRLKLVWEHRGTLPSARQGHLTRQKTYITRAAQTGAYVGTSTQVVEYLKHLKLD